ncbi:DUF4199 domain-containing protein [Flavivirga jejuensis]|uniref:DUF4199 domain-containing protein n=1 Tax=Flavivirga jejuensis TaxID=870487 RepID=A0ABT8WLZ7_9FLAO|nr:DUF4199 domain-containing protein [Flavivirga jejuensis]MDO5974174.1 DUF4199 domain-containing protein [Flavivirga jejuensis]
MEKSLKSIASNYGLYLGAILSLLTLIGYAVSLDLFTKIWFGIGFLLIIIVLGIISVSNSKKSLGGFISFKNAFTSYFITILIGLIVSAVVSIIIFNFIDPDAAKTLQEKIIETQIQRLESFNVPSEAIAETLEKMESQGNMYSIGNILQSIVWQLAGFSVVGLIVAAVMKKSNPDTE